MKISTKQLINRIILALAVAAVIIWFYPHASNSEFIYEQGRPWNHARLIAPFDIPVHPDSATIEAQRDSLNADFLPIYTIDANKVEQIISKFPDSIGVNNKQFIAEILRQVYSNGVVDEETMRRIIAGELPEIRILNNKMLSEQSTENMTSPSNIFRNVDKLITNQFVRSYFVSSDLQELLQPNVIRNIAEEQRLYDNEMQAITASRGVILQGQTIIDNGDIVTPQHFTNLQTYENMLLAKGEDDSRSSILMIIGQSVFVLILLSLLIAYLAVLSPTIYESPKSLIYVLSLVLLFFLLAAMMNKFVPGGIYIVPMAMLPVMILAFFDGRTAMFASMVTIMLCAPIADYPLQFIFLEFSATAVAIYTLGELRRRSQLMRMASAVAVSYVLGYVALELLSQGNLDAISLRAMIFLVVSALFTSMSYLLMFAVERLFGFVSVVTLVELSDINQPLLRKLSDVCPGTFQHCMSVSNLVSDAARALGANEELVRAGALYHDIGKLTNPAFFTENQHGVNPHDALDPQQSAGIIIGHVTEGLRLADKAGLPRNIKDFISQHHGAGRAKYFYYAYCKQHPEIENPDATPFTYPGPNPTTREASLLMMADSIEAASRSLPDYTQESISGLVNKIIDGQIAEGLHNNSTLQLRDVAIIKNAFIKRLATMYHTRIAYPSGVTGVHAK